MKRITRIFIIADDALRREIYNHVKKDIPKEWQKEYEYSGTGALGLPLEEDSKSYHYVMDMAKKYDFHPGVDQIVHYTKSEIEKTDYFKMDIATPLELEGTEASVYGTKYEGGCPNPKCHLGKKLVGDVFVDRKYMKKWDIGTLFPDNYMSEKLRELIHSEDITGVSFIGEVKDFKGREMPTYYVMDIEHILPPMAGSTWLINDPYPNPAYNNCGHQVIYLRSDVQYEKEKLIGAKDFNLSSEYIDNNRMQALIVSNRVRKLFKQHKIWARFSPIAVLE